MLTVNHLYSDGSASEINQRPSEICVVHLIWVPLGIDPLKDFLQSYSMYRAGIEHDLLIIFNGYNSEDELVEYKSLLSKYQHRSLLLWKFRLDIESYFAVLNKYNYKFFCFLNSYSRILAHEWLLKMYSYVSREDVGLVGATGSWESLYTNFIDGLAVIEDKVLLRRMVKWCKQKIKKMKRKYRYDPFPNYHIRTNGFMISREVMRKINTGLIFRKTDAYKFENGKSSMTKQIMDMGLKVLVVGKDGKGYEKEEWYKSETFRQGNQNNLLIADNQTAIYSMADTETKRILSHRTWGDRAYIISTHEGVVSHDN
jgi:hypothetical protein